MACYRFYQIDVFTETPLGGNPLAVFPEAEGLDPVQMQAIAREMNLSETTFVFPPEKPGGPVPVRIFTPRREIPFAGHPVLGTADVLRAIRSATESSEKSLVLGLPSGPVPVVWRDGIPFMDQPPATFQNPFPLVYRLGEALGLPQSAIHTWWPAQVGSNGFTALLVPLQGLKQVESVQLNLTVLGEILGEVAMVYVFSLETRDPECQVHARAFAPALGIPEDPATGSAAGILGTYLALHEVIDASLYPAVQIEQGLEMERPSRLQVKVEKLGDRVGSVQVGGKTRLVIEGTLNL